MKGIKYLILCSVIVVPCLQAYESKNCASSRFKSGAFLTSPTWASDRKTVIKRVNAGCGKYHTLKRGNYRSFTTEQHLEAIVDILYYLYAHATNKKQGFDAGMLVVQDAHFNLYNFLLEYVTKKHTGDLHKHVVLNLWSSGAYPRNSDHYQSYYQVRKFSVDQASGGNKYMHYGIDVPTDSPLALPIKGCAHVVFGKVDEGRGLTFVAMEPEGVSPAFVLRRTFSLGDLLSSKKASEKRIAQIIDEVKKRITLPVDVGVSEAKDGWWDKVLQWVGFKKEPVESLASYVRKVIESITTNDQEQLRHEIVPLDLTVEFFYLLSTKAAPVSKNEMKKFTELVNGAGIHAMINIIKNLTQKQKVNPQWKSQALAFVGRVYQKYDHVSVRIGREVILTRNELKD